MEHLAEYGGLLVAGGALVIAALHHSLSEDASEQSRMNESSSSSSPPTKKRARVTHISGHTARKLAELAAIELSVHQEITFFDISSCLLAPTFEEEKRFGNILAAINGLDIRNGQDCGLELPGRYAIDIQAALLENENEIFTTISSVIARHRVGLPVVKAATPQKVAAESPLKTSSDTPASSPKAVPTAVSEEVVDTAVEQQPSSTSEVAVDANVQDVAPVSNAVTTATPRVARAKRASVEEVVDGVTTEKTAVAAVAAAATPGPKLRRSQSEVTDETGSVVSEQDHAGRRMSTRTPRTVNKRSKLDL